MSEQANPPQSETGKEEAAPPANPETATTVEGCSSSSPSSSPQTDGTSTGEEKESPEPGEAEAAAAPANNGPVFDDTTAHGRLEHLGHLCKKGTVEEVKALMELDAGADEKMQLAEVGWHTYTAVLSRRDDIAKYLISEFPIPGQQAMQAAAKKGNLELIKWIYNKVRGGNSVCGEGATVYVGRFILTAHCLPSHQKKNKGKRGRFFVEWYHGTQGLCWRGNHEEQERSPGIHGSREDPHRFNREATPNQTRMHCCCTRGTSSWLLCPSLPPSDIFLCYLPLDILSVFPVL